MPNRYVRESAIESENVDKLSWAGEVFYRRLINRVDDFGRYTANLELLRASLFPLRVNKVSAADIGKWLSECETADLVSTWKGNDGKHYLVMHRWKDKRALKSKFPEPPDHVCKRLHTGENICKQTPTDSLDPDPDPDPDHEKSARVDGKSEEKSNPPRFQPPGLPEIQAYCAERKAAGRPPVDPEAWRDHYASNGWKVGKVPMRDWRAAVRTWERRNFNGSAAPGGVGRRKVEVA